MSPPHEAHPYSDELSIKPCAEATRPVIDPLEVAAGVIAEEQAKWSSLTDAEQAAAKAAKRAELPLWNDDRYSELGLLLAAHDAIKAEKAAAEPTIQPIDETSSPALAQEWLWRKRGGVSTQFDALDGLADRFDDLKAQGVTGEAILAEIRRDARPRCEPIWTMCGRLLPELKHDPIGSARRWAMKGGNNEPH